MPDDRYRISADDLDDYAGHPEGVALTTSHDPTPPPEALPLRVTPLSDASYPVGLQGVSSVATGPRGKRRTAARAFAWLVVTLFAISTTWQLVRLLKG